jgi:serine/threonine protein phosphatase PrpC
VARVVGSCWSPLMFSMSKFHTTIRQWGLVGGVRQMQSDMIIVGMPRSPFSPEARKGQLILLVEAEGDVACGREACTLVADTICESFYADDSMSITSSLRQALKAANAALYQHNYAAPPHKRAMVGVTCAVIHGADLFVTQVPPAQAYLATTGKLRALPVPPSWTNGADTSAMSLQGSLGTSLGSEPEFARAVIQAGDTLVLCSSNVARLLSKQQAEQLICYSDATTIAEELYRLCRAVSLPEAQTVVVEAVAGPAPDDQIPYVRALGWLVWAWPIYYCPSCYL